MKSIAILTARFFDPHGERIIFGGAERYLIDLVHLLENLGYFVHVYQGGRSEWTRVYDKVQIHSLRSYPSEYDVFPELNSNFHINTSDYDYHLYFSINMCYPQADAQSIAISHGIWWDSELMSYWRSQEWRNRIASCLRAPGRIVSVDTNTINWVRAEFPSIIGKMHYIPNYVDVQAFKPEPKQGRRFTVLFPRSLIDARGVKEVQYAAGLLLPRYHDMEFYFVGRGSEQDEDAMKKWVSDSTRVRYEWFDMKQMHIAYRQSDLVLIPSKYAEGTSLSALEALACGKVVVAGCTGGLTDIIIDNYNGFLIPVTANAIADKVEELYLNSSSMQRIAKRARDTALSFSKERWSEQWKELIRKVYPQ